MTLKYKFFFLQQAVIETQYFFFKNLKKFSDTKADNLLITLSVAMKLNYHWTVTVKL